MSGTNFNAEFNNPKVKISLTNEVGLATTVECDGDPNTFATDLNTYANGCILRRMDISSGSSLYQNNGTDITPSWTLLGAEGPFSSITGTPTEVAYFDAAGNGTSDSMFTRNETTKESILGFETYAAGSINDGMSQEVLWRADNIGSVGNAITLVFNGTDDTDTVLAAWNAANPSNTASVIGGTGNFVPAAQTITFAGGGQAGYEMSLNFLGQGFQYAGNYFNDGATSASINGLLNANGSGVNPFLGSFDFATSDQTILQMQPDKGFFRSQNATDGAVLNIDSYSRASLKFESQLLGNAGIEADNSSNLKFYSYGNEWVWPTADGTTGQALVTDGAGNLTFQTISATASLNEDYIGFGDSSNELTGDNRLKYISSSFRHFQGVPTNSSQISWGTPTFGGGLISSDASFDTSNYESTKYGVNLSITVTGAGGTFNWSATGAGGETVGSATGVVITGSLQTLSDNAGNEIIGITWSGTTHAIGGTILISTTLATGLAGSTIKDDNNNFFVNVQTINGFYTFGDYSLNNINGLPGNNTYVGINDQNREVGMYTSRYFSVKHPTPGTYTAVLADMENQRWLNYGEFRVLDVASGAVWFDVDSASKQIQIGDVQSTNNKTNLVVNDNSLIIHANTDGEFAVRNTTANKFLETATSTGVTKIGDIDSVLLDTLLTVDPTNDTIDFSAKGIDTNSVDIPITVKTTMSSSDILNMNTTPVIPTMTVPTGYAVQILDVYGRLNYNTTPYATNTTINIVFSTAVGQSVWQSANVLGDTANVIRRFTKTSGSAAEVVIPNDPLVITCIAGNPTAGDSTVDVYITYKLIEL